MFVIGGSEPRLTRGARIIDALALPHRIESEHHVAEPRQTLTAFLISLRGLSIRAEPHLKKNSGVGRLSGSGDIKIGGDVKLRPAFIDHVLEAIAGPVERCHSASA